MWEQKPETKTECVSSCGKIKEQTPTIYIDHYVMAKVRFLMNKYSNLEWLAYLIGKDDIVEDFYIPKQEVTGCNVTDIVGNPEISIMGVIHSHHNLGLHSFSGTDHAYINDNHDLSILVWNEKNGEIGINGQKKISLPCGAKMVVPIKIEYYHTELDVGSLEKEADENIQEKRYTYPIRVYPQHEDTRVGAAGPLNNNWLGRQGLFDDQDNLIDPVKKKWESESEEERKNDFRNRNPEYDDYLDALVYDDSFERNDVGSCGLGGDEKTEEEIEEHFRRIEERSCNDNSLRRKCPSCGSSIFIKKGQIKATCTCCGLTTIWDNKHDIKTSKTSKRWSTPGPGGKGLFTEKDTLLCKACTKCWRRIPIRTDQIEAKCPFCGNDMQWKLSFNKNLPTWQSAQDIKTVKSEVRPEGLIDETTLLRKTCVVCHGEFPIKMNQTEADCPFCGTNIKFLLYFNRKLPVWEEKTEEIIVPWN